MSVCLSRFARIVSLCVSVSIPALGQLEGGILSSKARSSVAWRQDPPPLQEDSRARRIRALRISEPIKIDGRFDEPAWAAAEAATDFRQQEPSEGVAASENTEVRLLYDDKNLYIGIHAFDSEPSRINARELVRDAGFSNDDKVDILL